MNNKKSTQHYLNELKSKLYYAETAHAALYETNFIYIDILKRELDYLGHMENVKDISPAKKPVRLGYMDKLYFPWVRIVLHGQDKQDAPPAWSAYRLQRD